MKKNLIAIAVAAAVIAPLTAQAAVDVSGDARVRYYTNDRGASDVGGNPNTKGAQTDSRVGLNFQGTDGKTAMAKARLEITNTHGGAAETINVDHAYIAANVGAGVKVTGGKTVANWGHKFVIWDAAADRVHITKKMGDLAMGLHFTKGTEAGLTATSDDTNDNSTTSVTVKMGKIGGLRYDMMKNETGAGSVDNNRTAFYGGAPLGAGWGLAFEYASTGGDSYTDNAVGMMLAAAGKVGGADLTVGYATAADGFNSDNDFFTFAGTGAQAGSMLAGLMSGAGYKMTGIFAIAKMKTGAAGVEAGVATINTDQAGDPSNTLLSVKVDYPLSKSTKVLAQYGTFSGDLLDGSTYGASIETKF